MYIDASILVPRHRYQYPCSICASHYHQQGRYYYFHQPRTLHPWILILYPSNTRPPTKLFALPSPAARPGPCSKAFAWRPCNINLSRDSGSRDRASFRPPVEVVPAGGSVASDAAPVPVTGSLSGVSVPPERRPDHRLWTRSKTYPERDVSRASPGDRSS